MLMRPTALDSHHMERPSRMAGTLESRRSPSQIICAAPLTNNSRDAADGMHDRPCAGQAATERCCVMQRPAAWNGRHLAPNADIEEAC